MSDTNLSCLVLTLSTHMIGVLYPHVDDRLHTERRVVAAAAGIKGGSVGVGTGGPMMQVRLAVRSHPVAPTKIYEEFVNRSGN
jgi:hypothetical protein